jgi:UDP-GlcNAc:undecaprenyl-phosphate GlcNAc-1-phosphate transferase
MYSSLFLILTAFLCCFLLTPVVRWLSLRVGLVDRPDPVRKIHAAPTPRLGGVAIALSYAAAFAVLICLPLQAGHIVRENVPLVWRLLPAVAVVFMTGVIDDIRNLRPWQKLLGQSIASALAWIAGVRILGIAGYSTESWWSLPVTMLWLIGCANSFNLIDGLDGVAAGIGLLAGLTAFVAAALQDNVALALAIAPLIGCLLGFLRYNFNPASIFLGDCGSLFIGFLLGCYAVIWSQKSATILGMVAPLIALAVPLLDTTVALARRVLRNCPVFSPDRGHIHHRLLELGLTPRRVALSLYAAAGLAAALSLLSQIAERRYAGLIVVVFCLGALAGVRALGILEFDVARQVLFPDSFRRIVDRHIALRQVETSLERAATLEEIWAIICARARDFGFLNVRLYVLGEMREAQPPDGYVRDCWQVRVPIGSAGYIDFEHSHYDEPHMVAPFIEVVCRRLTAVLPAREVGARRAGAARAG